MVKVPALAEDGQNWKIFHAKLLEYAAMHYCLDVLAGRPDDGTDNWDGSNALLWCTFMETVPLTIYVRVHHKMAHQIYKYLVNYFCDYEPIADPCMKKLPTNANEAKQDGAAAVRTKDSGKAHGQNSWRWRSCKWDNKEDLTTKDLTRGTEDPCTSLGALAEGTSAKSTGTNVLTGKLHEMQNQLQNSLLLTPRLPTEGKPNECKQEAADSIMMAGHTNQMVEMAEPTVVDVDIDRTALLGRDLAERASGVDKDNRTECEPQTRLQQMKLYCKANDQHGRNANKDVPNAYQLPLKGEWTAYASGKTTNLRSDANVSNAAVEHADHPGKSTETEDTEGVESEGHEGGMGEHACVDEADSDPGQGVEPTDTTNEPETLVTMLTELEDLGSGGIPCVYLGSMSWRACDIKGLGDRVDGSEGQAEESHGDADVSRGWTDAQNALNRSETDRISNSKGAGMYLGVGDAKCAVHTTDGVGSHADMSSGPTDVPSVKTGARIPVNAMETVRTPQKRAKLPDSPMETAKRQPDEPNSCRSHVDGPSVRMGVESVGNDTETAAEEVETVRTHQTDEKMQNSPNGHEIAMPELPGQWRKVSIGG